MWVETLPLCRYIVVGSSKYLLDHAAARAGIVLLFWGPDFHTVSIKIEALVLYEMTNLVTGKYVDLNFCAQASIPEKGSPFVRTHGPLSWNLYVRCSSLS